MSKLNTPISASTSVTESTLRQWLKELGIKADPNRFQDAQQWLDQKYFNKKEVKTIHFLDFADSNLIEKDIIGELIIKDFPNLKEISLEFSGYLRKLEIVNCPKLSSLSCQGNGLLTHLDLRECNQISRINAANNRLVFIKLPTETKKLTDLVINGNNFPRQTLDFLEPYTNLETLDIGSSASVDFERANLKEGRYNRFSGSLEPLKNMTKLDFLSIRNTDIDSGLEYLPLDNLKRFSCSANLRSGAKVAKIHAICRTDIFGHGLDKNKLRKYQNGFRQKNKMNQSFGSQDENLDQFSYNNIFKIFLLSILAVFLYNSYCIFI